VSKSSALSREYSLASRSTPAVLSYNCAVAEKSQRRDATAVDITAHACEVVVMQPNVSMDAQKKLRVLSVPVTVYEKEPTPESSPAEWHEPWTAERPETGEWVLCVRHGWWDEQTNKAHFDVPTLSAPFKTEDEVEAAKDKKIDGLVARGFIHKYTLQWDAKIMGMSCQDDNLARDSVRQIFRGPRNGNYVFRGASAPRGGIENDTITVCSGGCVRS
jgi:hypothetical protein